MKRFFKTTAVRLFAAAFAALLLGMLLSFGLRGRNSPFTTAVGLVTTPLQSLSHRLAAALRDDAAYFRSSKALQAQLEKKDKEIAALQERLVGYHDAEKKLQLYEEFLGLKRENPAFKFAPASIIGISGEIPYATLKLNRGTASGVKVQDPVLFGKYLVGVVVRVELTSCTVNTILHPDVKVGIYETASGEVSVAAADPTFAAAGLCTVPELARTTAVIPGSRICTSGRGGVYPKDLIFGTVTEVLDDNQNITATAIVEPAAEFSALRDVMVLIGQ